ncbi:class I SAM-dependent DNA methyltransferase [Mesorhizobium sp. PL10]
MNTGDKQNANQKPSRKRFKASQALHGDADRLAQYYREWASSYEQDLEREHYRGPSVVAELAGAVQGAYIGHERAAVTILDAGCGTGLVGVELDYLGFRLIDGFDLCETMAEMARQTGIYRNVQGDVDLNRPLKGYPSASYDMIVCCGVFTLGHVQPHRLRELARVARPNGFVVVSADKGYVEAASFKDEVLRLQEAGVLTPQQCLNNGSFVEEEHAHYWALRVLEKPTEPEGRTV